MMEIEFRSVILVGVAIFCGYALSSIRNKHLHPLFVAMWLCFILFLLFVIALPEPLRFVALNIFGFDDATNLVYVVIIGFLLFYCVYLSILVVRLTNITMVMLSKLAILESEIENDACFKKDRS